MADKRTEWVPDFDAYAFLGAALAMAATYGEALFVGEKDQWLEERRGLGQFMRIAFPGDQFEDWEDQRDIPDKPFLEAGALVSALHALIEGQLRRVLCSGSLQHDLLPFFKRYYHRELQAHMPEDKVRSSWRLADWLESLPADESCEPAEEQDGRAEALSAVERRLRQELRSFLYKCRLEGGLTRGELDAVIEAARAALLGARRHSRRGDSLSSYLSQAQMRQLRRGCRRYAPIKPFLAYLSSLKPRFERVMGEGTPAPGQTRKRRRIGNAYRDLARDAERDGLLDVAAGLRAIDKMWWELRLTDKEHELARRAREWVTGEWRQSKLSETPDFKSLCDQFLQDGSTDGAREFAQLLLRLALRCWPQGSAATSRQPVHPPGDA